MNPAETTSRRASRRSAPRRPRPGPARWHSLGLMHRLTLGLLVATHVVNDFYGGSVAVMVPFLIVERGYSYAAATGIVLASPFLPSLVQPGFGGLPGPHRLARPVG